MTALYLILTQWVAHPALVSIAKNVFDKYMPQPNQLYHRREDQVSAQDLLSTQGVSSNVTEQGLCTNIQVVLMYMDAWLSGNGCVPIHNLMEDAATAEISRSQVYQWIRHATKMTNNKVISRAVVQEIVQSETAKLFEQTKSSNLQLAQAYFLQGLDNFTDFLTTQCYDSILVKTSKL
jgi:malate synthase